MTNSNREIASIKIDGKYIDIIASRHAMERMEERNVDKYVVAGNVIALGPERIAQLQEDNDEAIIIDKENDVSVVVGFNSDKVTIITVIGKANVYVKSGTQIFNL